MGFAREGSNPSGVAFASNQGFMAEWSKALDSSSSLHLKAWVRIPLEPAFGSNPTDKGPVAQWIARLTSNQAVAGSSPARVGFLLRYERGALWRCQGRLLITRVWGISSIGRVRRLQRRGTGIETRILHCFAVLLFV